MTRSKSSRAPSLEDVRSRFDQWRRTRQGKAPIPDELWSAAATVARRNGVNPTAVALHLDGGKLKRRMVASNRAARKEPPAAFVELLAPGLARSRSELPESTLELDGRNGKLRIHCPAATAAEMAILSRALWDLVR